MNKLKLLIVEGNTKEENINFNDAGCVSQSQNFKKHIENIIEQAPSATIFKSECREKEKGKAS